MRNIRQCLNIIRNRKKNNQKGQVVVEYMLLVAVGAIAIVVATQLFNKMVLKSISDTISQRVSKQCSTCSR